MVVEFFVAGTPAPQGSMRAAVRNGRAVVFSDNKHTRPWRHDVAIVAKLAARNAGLREPSAGPAEVHVRFVMPPPAYIAKRIQKGVGRISCCVRPDVDKLIRAVFDALTDTVWVDDQQVYQVSASKRYPMVGEEPGAHVRVVLPEEE